MERGFSLTETIISLTLSLFILLFTSMFVDFVRKESLRDKEEMDNLQEFYSGIDRIAYEMKRCGLGLSNLWEKEEYKIFEISNDTISLRRGDGMSFLENKVFRGGKIICVHEPDKFEERKEIIITDLMKFEYKRIAKKERNFLTLSEALENDYPERSLVIRINHVSFKYDGKRKILRISQNFGPYQPLIENIESCSFKRDGNSVILEISFDKKFFNFRFFNPFGGEL